MFDFADACYFCSKYVTTKEHIPLLTQSEFTKNEEKLSNKIAELEENKEVIGGDR